MSSHYWCHGPHCHTYKTQDRVRGSKGFKVLRTKKIKQNTESGWYNPNSIFNYFCSQGCIFDFWNANAQRVITLAPRPTPLETPINDPEKKTYKSSYGDYSYTRTTITKVDRDSDVG